MREMQWTAAIRDGDAAALERIIERYSGYVMAVVRHTLGQSATQQDREELVSDVFVALWKNPPVLEDDGKLKPWLAAVARNTALNRARSLRPSEELQEDFIVTDASAVTAPVERAEQARIVREAVDGLGSEDRGLFVRHYFWRQSIADISAETGMNPSTIKSHLFRGRQVLKAALAQKGYTQ